MENGPDPGWVAVAHLTRPRGNKGELAAVSLTHHPERYQQLASVRVGDAELAVERVWYHKDQPVFKFRGIESISAAEPLSGKDVCVPSSERFPLGDGEFYFGDLIGCRMVDSATGITVGVVTGWQELGGPVVLEIDDGRVLVPYARAILQTIDIPGREIRVLLPEGLLDLNR